MIAIGKHSDFLNFFLVLIILGLLVYCIVFWVYGGFFGFLVGMFMGGCSLPDVWLVNHGFLPLQVRLFNKLGMESLDEGLPAL